MSRTITRAEYRRFAQLLARARKQRRRLDPLLHAAKSLVGKDDEWGGLLFDVMILGLDMPSAELLDRLGVEVQR